MDGGPVREHRPIQSQERGPRQAVCPLYLSSLAVKAMIDAVGQSSVQNTIITAYCGVYTTRQESNSSGDKGGKLEQFTVKARWITTAKLWSMGMIFAD